MTAPCSARALATILFYSIALGLGPAPPRGNPSAAQANTVQESSGGAADAGLDRDQNRVQNRDLDRERDADLDVALGIAGVWKIGQVTPVRLRLSRAVAERAAAVEINTFDGDGVPVAYRSPIPPELSTQDRQTFWSTVTIGRADLPLIARVIDADGKVLVEQTLEGDQLGEALPPGQPWIVALQSSLGVEATSHTLAASDLPSFSTTVLSTVDQVPDTWRGFAGCDVLIVATNGKEPLVSRLSDRQWAAIGGWIERGGSAVISLGEYASRVPADDPLRSLLPGKIVERLSSISTAPLEASTATNVQLAPIVATRLNDVDGQVELSLLDNSGKRFPWWVRYAIGKGVVHFIGSDLDEPVFRDWKDRRLVWDKILTSFWTREQQVDMEKSERNVAGTTYLGYEDMIGQLRATLDYFPAARIFSFGEATFMLLFILLIIGPLDYWVSVHWLRRPEASWYLSGLVLASSSLGLIWIEQQSRPKQLLLNSAQIVDFLPAKQVAHVDGWSHIYSSRARTIDVSATSSAASDDMRLDWQGLPGKGLGGMESNLLSDQGMPGYEIEVGHAGITPLQSPAVDQNKEVKTATVRGVGIPASGTKCLFATWSQAFNPIAQSQLSELRGIDQIEGRLVNPIDQDILRPVLLYHNWVYQLPSRIRSGEELNITYEMVPKDLLRRLNRRTIVNSNDVISRWIPDDRESIDRLLEIMMFYKASGGAAYTHLQHRFQPRIDTSNVLLIDHAILFGQLATPLGHMAIENVDEDQVKQETNTTWCRVLLPVARAQE